MEDNKDFDKDKQETGTQQMPHVPTEGEEDEKKGTIVLFGHEFDKKKAVMAGLGGLLAIALIGGGVWYAASQKPEPKEPTPIEQTEKTEQHVIQLGAKADGWVKGESSPVIAHIVNKEEKVDYYHAYDANDPHALDVPAEGEYEVSFISPVDKDGSIYEVPKTAKVKSEAEDKDGKDTGDELPFEFKPIAADKTDADALNAIVKSVGDAVKKGDETLTGANGTKVIEYNCRFGDPETQVVLPLLESDLLTVMEATTNGTLDKTDVKFSDGAAACVILASGGYPLAYEKGKEITGLTAGQLNAADVTVYHAGTAIKDGRLVTNGGRVLGVTATANTLPEALKKAYAATESIHFDKLHKRSDIGARALAAMQ